MANYLTYSNISDQISKAMGDMNQTRLLEVQAVINMVYCNEVLVCDDLFPLFWLMDMIDGANTKDSAALTGISKANPGVVTSAAHGFSDGDVVQFGVVTGMPEVNYKQIVVTNKAAGTYEMYDLQDNKIDTSGYAAVGTAGTAYHRGVTLSKSIAKVKSFSWQLYDGLIDPISTDEIAKDAKWMDTGNYTKPTRHHHVQNYTTAGVKTDRILWYPLPDDNYNGRIWAEIDADPMDSASDVPQLPFKFHNTIVSGSIARLVQYGEVQIENAVIWPGLYKMQLDAIKTYNRAWWHQFKKDERSGMFLI
jgi:hypothetical protein